MLRQEKAARATLRQHSGQAGVWAMVRVLAHRPHARAAHRPGADESRWQGGGSATPSSCVRIRIGARIGARGPFLEHASSSTGVCVDMRL
eukprot:958739-Prymnesium_polylepis.1